MTRDFKLGELVLVQGRSTGKVISKAYGSSKCHGIRYGVRLVPSTNQALVEYDSSQLSIITAGENENIFLSNN